MRSSKDVPFSIVMPVKNETRLLRDSLPSCYRVGPAEVVVCVDKPVPVECVQITRAVSSKYPDIRTRIIEVERNPLFRFHQAWVRREGFRAAENNRILTVDVDLIINANVLKAVNLVGRDDIGLVSCSKFHSVSGIFGLWRATADQLLRWFLQVTNFTGLYCIWKPYWLDTEDERIKKLENPRGALGPLASVGEDTFLLNCMVTKHRAVFLPCIGAYCMTPYSEDLRHAQFEYGRYLQIQGRRFRRVLVQSILTARMGQVQGYIYQEQSRQYVPTADPTTFPYPSITVGAQKKRTAFEILRDRLGIRLNTS